MGKAHAFKTEPASTQVFDDGWQFFFKAFSITDHLEVGRLGPGLKVEAAVRGQYQVAGRDEQHAGRFVELAVSSPV